MSGPGAAEVSRRMELAFQHVPEHEEMDTSVTAANAVVGELCTASEVDVRPEVPHMFLRLVRTLKELNYAGLQAVHTDAESKCDKSM